MKFKENLNTFVLYKGTNKCMPKKYKKTNTKDKLKAIVVEKVAQKHGVKPNYVYKITAGDRTNEKIFSDYMNGYELLVNTVNQLVPFN